MNRRSHWLRRFASRAGSYDELSELAVAMSPTWLQHGRRSTITIERADRFANMLTVPAPDYLPK